MICLSASSLLKFHKHWDPIKLWSSAFHSVCLEIAYWTNLDWRWIFREIPFDAIYRKKFE